MFLSNWVLLVGYGYGSSSTVMRFSDMIDMHFDEMQVGLGFAESGAAS
jgi:hypothetical protein